MPELLEAPTTPSPKAGLPPSMMRHQAKNQAQVMRMKVRCQKQEGEEEKERKDESQD